MILTKKQSKALDYLEDKTVSELLFGGGAGGGKSALGCFWQIKQRLKYPGTRGLIGRAKHTTLRETTLKTFFEVLSFQKVPPSSYKFNSNVSTIQFFNGSEIMFTDLADYPSDPNFDELGSLEITDCFVDEANQISEKCKQILKSRLRFKLDCNGLIPKMLYTCNPAKNWTYKEFYKPCKEGKLPEHKAFIQSLAIDNTHISKHYRDNLLTLDKVSRERLLYGNWEYDDDPSKLIEYDNILAIFDNKVAGGEKYLTADIARYGSDKGVVGLWNGMRCESITVINKKSIVETSAIIRNLAVRHQIPIDKIIVDEEKSI
jgi:phage terminase large subunit